MLYKAFELSCKKHAEQIALRQENAAYTYHELHELSELYAKNFQEANCPSNNYPILGIILKDGIEFIAALFAAVKCKLIVLPIHHLSTATEVETICIESKVEFIWAGDEFSFLIPDNFELQKKHNLLIYKNKIKQFNCALELCDHPAFIRYTSGTTSAAKGVLLSEESVLQRSEISKEMLGVNEQDSIAWMLPMAYHFIASITTFVLNGACIIPFASSNLLQLEVALKQAKFTKLFCMPVQLMFLNDSKLSKSDFENVTAVYSTATALAKDTAQRFYEKFNIPVTQIFGNIELGMPIVNKEKAASNPDCLGVLSDKFSMKLFDEENGLGILGLKGPGMFNGYLNPPTKINDVLRDGYFLTGDIAEIKEEKSIYLRGRKKSVINVMGNKVFPEAIESVLNAHPLVMETLITAYVHPQFGELLQCNLVVKEGFEILDFKKYCRKELNAHSVPVKIKIVSHLPKTNTGKLIRK